MLHDVGAVPVDRRLDVGRRIAIPVAIRIVDVDDRTAGPSEVVERGGHPVEPLTEARQERTGILVVEGVDHVDDQ